MKGRVRPTSCGARTPKTMNSTRVGLPLARRGRPKKADLCPTKFFCFWPIATFAAVAQRRSVSERSGLRRRFMSTLPNATSVQQALTAYGLASVRSSQTHPGAFMSLRICTMSSANSLRIRSFCTSAAASAA